MTQADSVVPLSRPLRLFGRKITLAWQKSVEGILEAGALLIQVKAEHHHGDFERMVRNTCPFNRHTANKLMSIASNEVLSNGSIWNHLPSSWTTLYELSRFEPRELKHAIGNHWVKADMPGKDVEPLRRRTRQALGLSARTRVRRASATPAEKNLARDNVVEIEGKANSDRWADFADLADQGHTSDQIADKFGVSRRTVVKRAAKLGIALCADQVIGRSRKIDPDRALRDFANTLESLVPSCEMVDPSNVTPEALAEYLPVIAQSMRELNRFLRKMEGAGS